MNAGGGLYAYTNLAELPGCDACEGVGTWHCDGCGGDFCENCIAFMYHDCQQTYPDNNRTLAKKTGADSRI